jgi:hypothetical protein
MWDECRFQGVPERNLIFCSWHRDFLEVCGKFFCCKKFDLGEKALEIRLAAEGSRNVM